MGDVGTGKTHIACAILQQRHRGLYFTQSVLLSAHRATYGNNSARDVQRDAMLTPLFVLAAG